MIQDIDKIKKKSKSYRNDIISFKTRTNVKYITLKD